MGLLSELLLLPIAPIRGVRWLAEQVDQEAKRLSEPSPDLEEALEALDRKRAAGELTLEEAEREEEALLKQRVEGGPDG